MRFYQLETKQKVSTSPEGEAITGPVTYWFNSERDAVIARNEMFKGGSLIGLKREQAIYPVDVPTDKPGLFTFLKDNVTRPVIVE